MAATASGHGILLTGAPLEADPARGDNKHDSRGAELSGHGLHHGIADPPRRLQRALPAMNVTRLE